MGAGALRDGGDPDSRLRRADADDDARQAVGPPRGRVRPGCPVPPHASLASPGEAAVAALPAPFPLFVKPRWEGTAKGIGPSSRVESREALVAEVARVVGTYGQPALVEAFLEGPEYTVTLVGEPAATGVAHAAAGTGGVDAHRRARAPAAPAAAGGLAPRHAGRTRRDARGGAGQPWPGGRSRRWSAGTSPVPTSASTVVAGPASSR